MVFSYSDKVGSSQHFVFQFLLRKFCNSKLKQNRLWALNKADGKIFHPNIINIGCENGFFDCSDEHGNRATVDDFRRAEYESPLAQAALNELVNTRSFDGINRSNKKKVAFCKFIAALRLGNRVEKTKYREELLSAGKNSPDTLKQYGMSGTLEESEICAALLSTKADKLVGELRAKRWLLHIAPNDAGYVIGDNPVALNNELEVSPNTVDLGYRATGIQFFLPLAHNVLLHMVCPKFVRWCTETQRVSESLLRKTPINDPNTQVKTANLIQAINAETQVYAREKSDLEHIAAWLEKFPAHRQGPRPMDHCKK